MVSTARQLLTPNQLNAYMGKRPSACSTNLGWSWMRVECWRKPTGRGELHCPGGTHHELIVPLSGSSTTLRRFADTEYESADPTLLIEFDFIPRGHENYWRWQGAGCDYAPIDIAPEFLRQVPRKMKTFAQARLNWCLSPEAPIRVSAPLPPVWSMRWKTKVLRATCCESLMISLAARILHTCTVESPAIAPTELFLPVCCLESSNESKPTWCEQVVLKNSHR